VLGAPILSGGFAPPDPLHALSRAASPRALPFAWLTRCTRSLTAIFAIPSEFAPTFTRGFIREPLQVTA
jgi:hypothetical protein